MGLQTLALEPSTYTAMYRRIHGRRDRRLHASTKAIQEANEGSIAFHSNHDNDYSDYNPLATQKQKSESLKDLGSSTGLSLFARRVGRSRDATTSRTSPNGYVLYKHPTA